MGSSLHEGPFCFLFLGGLGGGTIKGTQQRDPNFESYPNDNGLLEAKMPMSSPTRPVERKTLDLGFRV